MNLTEFPLVQHAVIYFLLWDQEIVYIGQTYDLSGRISAHQREKSFNRVFYMRAPAKKLEREQQESALIHFYRPKFNSLPANSFVEEFAGL